MTETFRPESNEQLVEAIRWAASSKTALELVGTQSKQVVGNLMETGGKLDLTGLTGISLYEPEELVLAAGAGCLLNDIEKLLADKNQAFAFEPPDMSHLLGSNSAGTLGGMVASGFAGPRRVQAGGVRDHVLGVRAVSGRGETFKTGGRVVKNVTGYDLPKILTGSWGTLAAMTQVTFKVLPKPETEATLALIGLDNDAAIKAMCAALGTPLGVSGAAHVPGARTLLRLEGIAPSVGARLESLKSELAKFGEMEVLGRDVSRDVWRNIRDVRLIGTEADNPIWRLSVPPSQGAEVLAKIEQSISVNSFFDWGGGLIWLEVLEQDRACAAEIRGAIGAQGGHATLIRASRKSRAGSAVFQPQSATLSMLARRLKDAFDPLSILNPGRMQSSSE
ncbi:MAG TPA: glycolate oxidase subunit GlcE [Rhizobiales bacterium]|nr:glycolate oxidase subunit GlcE [Hyphomicrobiales bacterium]